MAVREILKYPNRILRVETRPVTEINGELQELIDEMAETMYAAPGVGLAANQIGSLKRVCIIDIAQQERRPGKLLVLINPEIVEFEGESIEEEGCLSIPGYSAKIRRFARVLVKGYDREGKELEIEGEGLLARALQHELDHLKGVLFIDHLSPLKRNLFKKRWQKIQREKKARNFE